MKSFRILTVASLIAILPLIGLNCGPQTTGDSASGGNPPAQGTNTYTWTQVGPRGGIIANLLFNPGHPGEVWASGDDGSGLYRSSDSGATWQIVQTGVQNQATYSLKIDPNDSNKIFAPNHFGRGMFKSTNNGATWTSNQAGLPLVGNDTELLFDIAVNPTDSSKILVATDLGLYRSVDGGNTFSANSTTAVSNGIGVRAVAYRADGVAFVGKTDGSLGYSGDNGTTWNPLLGVSGIPFQSILFSNSSIYLAYKSGAIYRLDKNSLQGGLINDPSQPNSIQSSNRLAIAVKSGASAATDIVIVGTAGMSTLNSGRWGFFKSTNSGATWTQMMNGMSGNYVMSVAIDPNNSNNLLAGSTNSRGLFRSTDGGANWVQITSPFVATASLALAQDPTNPSHMVTSTTACGGFGTNYETTDGGNTWSPFADPTVDDGVFSFDVDPSSSQTLLAGTCKQGIYRSTNGRGGPWVQIVNSGSNYVDRFVRDKANPNLVYAVIPGGDSTHSLYYSFASGANFSARSNIVAWSIAPHPTHAGEAIVVSGPDAYASTDGFNISKNSLNMAAIAGQENGLSAVAFNPSQANEVLVGGSKGGIYKTSNYVPTGAGVSWTKLVTPITSAPVRDIVIVSRGGRSIYYAATAGGQTGYSANSTVGVFRSLDGGQSWQSLSSQLFPSSLTWRLIPDAAAPTTSFLLGMWSGGLFKLSDNQ